MSDGQQAIEQLNRITWYLGLRFEADLTEPRFMIEDTIQVSLADMDTPYSEKLGQITFYLDISTVPGEPPGFIREKFSAYDDSEWKDAQRQFLSAVSHVQEQADKARASGTLLVPEGINELRDIISRVNQANYTEDDLKVLNFAYKLALKD
jgi:hypothetical protein